MNHYRAFRRKDGIQLIPIDKEAVYILGVIFTNGVLTLTHPSRFQKLETIEQMNKFGQVPSERVNGNMTPLKERRIVEQHHEFNLFGDEVTWFVKTFVDNAEDCELWIDTMLHPVGHQNNPEEGNDPAPIKPDDESIEGIESEKKIEEPII